MIRRTIEEHHIDSLLYEERCHIFHIHLLMAYTRLQVLLMPKNDRTLWPTAQWMELPRDIY